MIVDMLLQYSASGSSSSGSGSCMGSSSSSSGRDSGSNRLISAITKSLGESGDRLTTASILNTRAPAYIGEREGHTRARSRRTRPTNYDVTVKHSRGGVLKRNTRRMLIRVLYHVPASRTYDAIVIFTRERDREIETKEERDREL